MKSLSLVVLTANALRHMYVANHLAEHFDVRGVVTEAKRPLKAGNTKEEDDVIAVHNRERTASEEKYFGKHQQFRVPLECIHSVPYEGANTEETYAWIKERNPDFLALFGTGIIKDPLLSAFENRIVNMHLGLSPYYRGSGTNFWPLVFGEPELVGVTVHLAVSRVDAGSILGQVRPDIKAGDDSHDIGHKAIIQGANLMAACIQKYAEGSIIPQTQDLSIGKVIKHKDFGADAVVRMKQNFAHGMIEAYLAHKDERVRPYPIVEVL